MERLTYLVAPEEAGTSETCSSGKSCVAPTAPNQTRLAAANEAEHADLDVLPGSLLLPALNIDVQPDVWVTGPSVQLLVEAKGFRKGATFNVEQLPRELLCLQAHSGNRAPLLLLVLTTPPPIRLAGSGRHEVDAGVAVGLESLCARAGMSAADYEGFAGLNSVLCRMDNLV